MDDTQGAGVEIVPTDPAKIELRGNQHGNYGKLTRPHVFRALIRDLALGDETKAALARRHGVSSTAVVNFATRHALEIEATKQRLTSEFDHLWAAQKVNRVATYQGMVEHVQQILDDVDLKATVNTAEMFRTQQQALKSIAEEMGQLKQQVEVTGIQVTYHVEGVDMSKLQ